MVIKIGFAGKETSSNTISMPPQPFELFTTLQGARDAVLSVRFSLQARFVSATGFNGVNVWSLDSLLPVALPRKGSLPTKPRYIYPASAWVYFEEHGRHVLLLGSLEGEIAAWDWNEKRAIFEPARPAVSAGHSKQITSIDVSQPSFGGRARVAVGHENCQVSVWKLPLEGSFIKILNVDLGFIPRTVLFDCLTNRIFAFAMAGSRIVQLSSKSGKITWSSNAVPATIGFAALHQESERVALSTGRDLRIYQLPSCLHLQTMESGPPIVRFPKQVAFTLEGDLLVAGTDAGKAIVYDTRSGKATQSLKYPRGGLVQSVAAGSTRESCYVAVAGSASQQPSDVIIWHRKVPGAASLKHNNNSEDVNTQDEAVSSFPPPPRRSSALVTLLCVAFGCLAYYHYSHYPKIQLSPIRIVDIRMAGSVSRETVEN
ncbi:hypothetical protein V5O48_009789 [Marasmius crinis-equi]|uniref:WD40 repeat-like protein n=1 Tax=Marasmius crinis-equi TaxID=585013 RepID=A0ABR3FAE1_9AGAR